MSGKRAQPEPDQEVIANALKRDPDVKSFTTEVYEYRLNAGRWEKRRRKPRELVINSPTCMRCGYPVSECPCIPVCVNCARPQDECVCAHRDAIANALDVAPGVTHFIHGMYEYTLSGRRWQWRQRPLGSGLVMNLRRPEPDDDPLPIPTIDWSPAAQR